MGLSRPGYAQALPGTMSYTRVHSEGLQTEYNAPELRHKSFSSHPCVLTFPVPESMTRVQ